MKNIKPFGPTIGKTKISKKFLDILNKEIDNKVLTKNNDYSYKLASQIKKEIKISDNFIKKNLEREIKKNIKSFSLFNCSLRWYLFCKKRWKQTNYLIFCHCFNIKLSI